MFELILPQNPLGKYEKKLYLEYLLQNSDEKIEDMICNMSRISLQKPRWGKFEI